ncbi:MAG: hypothetical protein Q8Q05_03990 [bacterium]|nr:hypothetical protein [bacterium]
MNELYNVISGWMLAFFVGAIVIGVAILLWLCWFSPVAVVVLAAVAAMAWFALSPRPVADPELDLILLKDEAESG